MKKLCFLILLFSFTVAQSQVKISGVITDNSNMPLIGASIVEKGTLNGTSADISGNFALTVNANSTLVVSYIGYKTLEVAVDDKKEYKIILQEGVDIGEVQIVGSRSYSRSVTDSPVPVDIIDIDKISTKNGKVEVNQILQFAVPSFNASKQSGSDGADHIDPASLRGLGPDQTLVLINGKRRHQSSLINLFGTRGRGNTGTDLNAIPVASIKRLEVLRDGASAQYGSDAIAGVINIVLKDNTDGVSGSVTYGAHSTHVGGDYAQQIFDTQDGWDPELFNIKGKNRIDGKDKSFDGETTKFDLNYGAKLGKSGFVNVTTELLDKNHTLRPSFEWRKGYGSAAVDGFNVMVNSAVPLDEQTEIYAFGGRNYRNTDAYAFTRDSYANGDNRSVPELYPDGFSPNITSVITDVSASAGLKRSLTNGWIVDFNNTYGKNNFHYYITGTNNASLGTASPTSFDAGGHSLSTNTTGIDLSKFYKDKLEGINLAFGMEYRTENFQIFAGEEGSYAQYDENGIPITNPAVQFPATDSNGDILPGSSQGFPGYSPANEVNAFRSNFGAYFDTELNLTKSFMLSGALRYESYSDFGKTLNFKLASRLKATENLTFRGSVSSGFRAPSLAQIYYNLIFTNMVVGESVQTILASNTSTIARLFGINSLKQETANNYSLGFTYRKGAFKATVDAYSIGVKDRIILTDYFDATSLNMGVESAQFFANGVNTRTNGIDVIVNYSQDIGKGKLNLAFSGNMNKLKIDKINSGNLNEYTFFSPFSRAYLEAAAPKSKLAVTADYSIKKITFSVTATRFSEIQIQDFQWVDAPATTDAEAEALFLTATDVYEAAIVSDFNISYRINSSFTFTFGANNLFNVYPTPQFDGWTDQGGFNDSVQMGSDGTYIFGRLGFSF